MQRFLRALGALVFLGVGSGAACSLLVASEFSGYSLAPDGGDDSAVDSGTCSLANPGGFACGACVAQQCQGLVTKHCAESIVMSSLSNCVADPSPGSFSGGTCSSFVGDAAFVQEDMDFDLRACVSTNCTSQCTTCVDVDAGAQDQANVCGQCIHSQCEPLLSGVTGCCTDQTVQLWIGDCTFYGHQYACQQLDSTIRDNYSQDGGPPGQVPNDAGNCEGNFANCVYNKCVLTSQCKYM
jgi:hypothetical protein